MGGAIEVLHTRALGELKGLEGVESLGDGLSLSDNSRLKSLAGLAGLKKVSLDRSSTIYKPLLPVIYRHREASTLPATGRRLPKNHLRRSPARSGSTPTPG